jgi:hypothetical protein
MSLKEKSAITMDNAFPKPTLMGQRYGNLFYEQIFFDIIPYKVKKELKPKSLRVKGFGKSVIKLGLKID